MHEIKKECQINYYFCIGLRYLDPTICYITVYYCYRGLPTLKRKYYDRYDPKTKNNNIIIIPSYFLVLFCKCIPICYS